MTLNCAPLPQHGKWGCGIDKQVSITGPQPWCIKENIIRSVLYFRLLYVTFLSSSCLDTTVGDETMTTDNTPLYLADTGGEFKKGTVSSHASW